MLLISRVTFLDKEEQGGCPAHVPRTGGRMTLASLPPLNSRQSSIAPLGDHCSPPFPTLPILLGAMNGGDGQCQ